jgi:hypothetical protein
VLFRSARTADRLSVGQLISHVDENMSMKLLPASVNPVDPSQASDVSTRVSRDVSTSLVPLTQRAITTRAGQISLVPSADAFAWSSSAWSTSTRRGQPNRIHGTPVEDSQSDETADEADPSRGQYVSGWAWSRPIESTAVAHYLSYAASPAAWSGWLIDVYA